MTTQEILQVVHDWTNGKIVYDISVAHPDRQGNPTKYADLTAALGTGGGNIPEGLRKGGMSIKFIQSSDNKYVQCRYMGTETTGNPNPFLDTDNWTICDAEFSSGEKVSEVGIDNEPTAGSDNLVKSGGVYAEVEKKANIDGYYESMGVGTADNLTGQTERTNNAMYRKTGGSEEVTSGTATISNIKGQTVAWNQMVDTDTVEVTPVNGRKICTVINGVKNIVTSDGSAIAVSGGTDMVFDLTLIYGAGNEPTTPEQFEADYFKWFGKPLTYEDYDAGSLRSVQLDSLKTTGFNQWDEEWVNGYVVKETGKIIENSSKTIVPKNLIPVVYGKTYYFNRGGYITMYDANQAVVNQIHQNYPSTLGIEAPVRYIRFHIDNYGRTYNHDICINISDTSRNGEYEPYEEHSVSLSVTTMSGKLNGEGESVVVFPDGMNMFDNIYAVGDKTFAVVGGQIRAYQDGDATSDTMVTDGVNNSYVALETPQVYELDTFDLPKPYQVDADGTEEQIQKSGVQGLAAILTCIYGVDAVKILDKLPQNYISEASMDNFLAQLNTVTGGTWTKTWNENTGEWDFSFTANAQTNDTNIEETI